MGSLVRLFGSLALVAVLAVACTGRAAKPLPDAVHVTGSETHDGSGGTEVLVGNITQMRGAAITSQQKMSDPRVSGKATGTVNTDMLTTDSGRTTVGKEWGTTRIENKGGAWEGTIAGAIWAGGSESDLTGWLVGSGDYEGYTYYWHLRATDSHGDVDGVIYKGPPPSPEGEGT